MPFNGTSKLVEALFAFVDQYQPGDNALRSGFDQFLQDLIGAINEQAAYTQSLTGANPDARYLGRIDAVPTTRDDLSPLQEGDWYVSGNAAAGRVNLGYIYDGANFLVMSDFSSVGATGVAMMAAATQAAGRGVLGLGTAATQNSTAFADASVATTIGLALKLADTSGLALPVSGADWDNAHSTHPGTCFLQGSAATANAPAAVNLSGMYVAYDANNGFILLTDHTNGAMYMRRRIATVWGTWRESVTVNQPLARGDLLRQGVSLVERMTPTAARQVVAFDGTDAVWELPDYLFELNASLAGANVTTPQDIFPLDLTLDAGIYQYELCYSLVKTAGATGHNVRVFFGGTATFNNAYRSLLGTSAINVGVFLTAVVGALGFTATMSDNVNISGTLSNANSMVHLVERGTFSVNVAGTVIPKYILSAAPGGAYSVQAGSYFKVRKLGASGADIAIGPWA